MNEAEEKAALDKLDKFLENSMVSKHFKRSVICWLGFVSDEKIQLDFSAVERDLAELKNFVCRTPEARPWYGRTVGSMKDYPEFAEVVRLGRELRKAEHDVPGAAE